MDELPLPDLNENEALLAGRYRLVTLLGEGGMGQVHQAEHVLMKKTVAIKILHAELSENPEMVARFQREAQAAAALDSPNVCQATDFGQTEDGSFFLVMEYLQGETLQERLKSSGPLPQEQALHILRQIATALVDAHRQGIVHRDLKPENIMLIERDGEPDFVKIMDFGIARLVATTDDEGIHDEDAPKLTRKGLIYGTPHYMSPEQVAGEEVDHRSDLYALGVILFEMLTGKPPFNAPSIARVMAQHVMEPPPTLAERSPEAQFPPFLEELIARLLAKGRQDRPASASQLIESLDELLEESEPEPEPSPPIADSPATSGPHPLQLAIDKALTKAQEFWSSLSRESRRLVIVATLATGATIAAAIIFIALVLSLSSKSSADLEKARQSLANEDAVAQALNAAASGERNALEELLEERGDNAHLRYLVLMADLEAKRSVAILDEAKLILEAEKRYAHDEELMSLIASRLHRNDEQEAARALLTAYFTPAARDALAQIAMVGSSNSRRNAAFELLSEKKALSDLKKWQRLSIELRQASGCDAHKEKIQAIESLGDPRALPTLKAVQATPTTGCGTLRLQDCLGCIRGDLRQAIGTLENIED